VTHAPATERYERSDASPRPLFLSGLVLAALIAVSLLVCAWITDVMTASVQSGERVSPISDLRQPPEGPPLQSRPAGELEAQRAWEEELLTGTAWIDPVNRVVRIPVERAMELCLEEGFPVREEVRK
jgi:hypothetical protein